MIARRLGAGGPYAGALALGCMGLSEFYAPVEEREAIATIHRALALGMTLLDTSDMYGQGANERLVGRALHDRREQALIATKTGIVRRADDPTFRAVDGRPERIAPALDASLARLGVDYVDVYYVHRVDPAVPIEETIGAMRALVDAGKVRLLGLSETTPETLRRAATTAPIALLQSEFSLFTRDVETNGVLETARTLGTSLVAYAPLGRGMLTGTVRSRDALGERDLRRAIPRFDEENMERNLALVDALAGLAHEVGCTPAQLSLAWVIAQGDDILAVPGCDSVAQVEENAGAGDLVLSTDVLQRIDALVPPGAAAGARLRDMRFINR